MPFVRHLLIFEMGLTIQNPGIAEFRLIMLLLFSSCWSHVGKTGLKQPISLAPDCWYYGIVVHEIGGLVIFHLRYPYPNAKVHPFFLKGGISLSSLWWPHLIGHYFLSSCLSVVGLQFKRFF